jgi:hypothetical protein
VYSTVVFWKEVEERRAGRSFVAPVRVASSCVDRKEPQAQTTQKSGKEGRVRLDKTIEAKEIYYSGKRDLG